jgi:hypothetical protein
MIENTRGMPHPKSVSKSVIWKNKKENIQLGSQHIF